jgi:hypothetical protein
LRSSLEERALARVSKDGREFTCGADPSRRLLRKLLRMRLTDIASIQEIGWRASNKKADGAEAAPSAAKFLF